MISQALISDGLLTFQPVLLRKQAADCLFSCSMVLPIATWQLVRESFLPPFAQHHRVQHDEATASLSRRAETRALGSNPQGDPATAALARKVRGDN